MGSTEIVFAHTIIALVDKVREYIKYDIGVYGASMTGKTTLDKQLTTPGLIRPLKENQRTHHKLKALSETHRMPEATAKQLVSKGRRKTVVSRDIGGHDEYQYMWLKDMYSRKIKAVIVVIDHRHLLDPENTDNQLALGYLVESLAQKKAPKSLGLWTRFRRRHYRPEKIILLANKADEWLVTDTDFEMWEKGMISNHAIFDVFREHLFMLQEMHIPVHIDAISAIRDFNVQDTLMRALGLVK